MQHVLFQALRQLRREWKAGEILALGAAMAIAVGAITAVVGFSERIMSGLERSAGEVIAADIKLASRESVPVAIEEEGRRLGLLVARTTAFPTVLFDKGQTLLVSVKGVTEGYPLRGALKIKRSLEDDAAEERVVGIPAPGELWADPRVFYSLGAQLGDTLQLGNTIFRLTAVLTYEPDRGGQFFSFSPRLMINATDLQATGLLGPASRARYALLAAGPVERVDEFKAVIEPALDRRIAILDLDSAQEQVGATVSTARDFIGLSSLATLLIAGLAITVASRRYVDRRRRQTALLRTFGASSASVLLTHLIALSSLGLGWGVLGAAGGFAVQEVMAGLIGSLLPGTLPAMGIGPAFLGIILGTLLLVAFSVPSFFTLARIAPIEVLRSTEKAGSGRFFWLIYLIPIGGLIGLTLTQVASPLLVLFLAGGIALSLIVMMALSVGVLIAMKSLSDGAGVSWRFGLGRLIRNKTASTFQISTIGLGLSILILLSVVRGQLFDAWESRTPDDAPNFFFANIQPIEREGMARFFREQFDGAPAFTPMATGRLVAINGATPVAEDYPDPRTSSRIDGNLNFSWASSIPPGNEIVAGHWWEPGSSEPVVSLAARWAEPLRVDVGDTISVRSGAQVIEARIINIREVQWESLTPNFFVLFPPAVLEDAPHTYLSAARLESEDQKKLIELNRLFPTINIIDVGAILAQVRRVLDLVSLALNLVFAFTLAAGGAVLFSVMQTNQESRIRDVAMLKVLGCDRRRIRRALNFEFLTIAIIAGALAGTTALLTGQWLAERVFEIPYATNYRELIYAFPTSVIIVWLVSVLGVRRAEYAPPQALLKDVTT